MHTDFLLSKQYKEGNCLWHGKAQWGRVEMEKTSLVQQSFLIRDLNWSFKDPSRFCLPEAQMHACLVLSQQPCKTIGIWAAEWQNLSSWLVPKSGFQTDCSRALLGDAAPRWTRAPLIAAASMYAKTLVWRTTISSNQEKINPALHFAKFVTDYFLSHHSLEKDYGSRLLRLLSRAQLAKVSHWHVVVHSTFCPFPTTGTQSPRWFNTSFKSSQHGTVSSIL